MEFGHWDTYCRTCFQITELPQLKPSYIWHVWFWKTNFFKLTLNLIS